MVLMQVSLVVGKAAKGFSIGIPSKASATRCILEASKPETAAFFLMVSNFHA